MIESGTLKRNYYSDVALITFGAFCEYFESGLKLKGSYGNDYELMVVISEAGRNLFVRHCYLF